MIDSDGHIVHIDYGFIFGGRLCYICLDCKRVILESLWMSVDSPGFNINFESAPFKFTRDYADVMGGLDSEAFKTFEDLFVRGFAALQRHTDGLSAIVEVQITFMPLYLRLFYDTKYAVSYSFFIIIFPP